VLGWVRRLGLSRDPLGISPGHRRGIRKAPQTQGLRASFPVRPAGQLVWWSVSGGIESPRSLKSSAGVAGIGELQPAVSCSVDDDSRTHGRLLRRGMDIRQLRPPITDGQDRVSDVVLWVSLMSPIQALWFRRNQRSRAMF